MHRLPSLFVLLALFMLPFAGCGSNGDGDSSGGTGTGAATVATSGSTGTDGDSDGGGEALAQQCTNERAGFEMRYPEGWHADDGCEWFHPEPFELPENQDVTGIAIHVRQEPIPIDRAAQGGPGTEVLSREQDEVDGHRAERVEIELTEQGLMPAGTRGYHWTVELDADRSLRGSTFSTGGLDYDRNREVLDEMMRSVEVSDEERCSASGLDSELPDQELPAPVARTRQAIADAAVACDYGRLEQLAQRSPQFTYSFGDEGAPAEHWRRNERSGAEPGPLRAMVELLRGPQVRIGKGNAPIYAWPSAYGYKSWKQVPRRDREALRPLYGTDDFERFGQFGSYAGYRLGIAEDGSWMYFVAGD